MRRRLGDIEKKILILIKSKPCGLTIEEVSEILKINRATAVKYLMVLCAKDKILVRELGKAKLHYPKTRKVEAWLI